MKEENDTVKVDKTIEKLNTIIRQLKLVFSNANKNGHDPFVEVSYEDMEELRDELIPMLKEYKHWLQEYEDGNILLNWDGDTIQLNPPVYMKGENAPAYKKSIDEELIYKLWQGGRSIREIAKRAGCSPDTVKRRVAKIQHRVEKGGKI